MFSTSMVLFTTSPHLPHKMATAAATTADEMTSLSRHVWQLVADDGVGIERETRSRFVDLVSELREFGLGQTAVFVAVETLDKVQSAVLRVMQLVAQDRHRFVECDVPLAAETTHTHTHTQQQHSQSHRRSECIIELRGICSVVDCRLPWTNHGVRATQLVPIYISNYVASLCNLGVSGLHSGSQKNIPKTVSVIPVRSF